MNTTSLKLVRRKKIEQLEIVEGREGGRACPQSFRDFGMKNLAFRSSAIEHEQTFVTKFSTNRYRSIKVKISTRFCKRNNVH